MMSKCDAMYKINILVHVCLSISLHNMTLYNYQTTAYGREAAGKGAADYREPASDKGEGAADYREPASDKGEGAADYREGTTPDSQHKSR